MRNAPETPAWVPQVHTGEHVTVSHLEQPDFKLNDSYLDPLIGRHGFPGCFWWTNLNVPMFFFGPHSLDSTKTGFKAQSMMGNFRICNGPMNAERCVQFLQHVVPSDEEERSEWVHVDTKQESWSVLSLNISSLFCSPLNIGWKRKNKSLWFSFNVLHGVPTF